MGYFDDLATPTATETASTGGGYFDDVAPMKEAKQYVAPLVAKPETVDPIQAAVQRTLAQPNTPSPSLFSRYKDWSTNVGKSIAGVGEAVAKNVDNGFAVTSGGVKLSDFVSNILPSLPDASRIASAPINKSIDYAANILSDTAPIKAFATASDNGSVPALTTEEIFNTLSQGNDAISGLTGGIINVNHPAADNLVGNVASIASQGVGMMVGLGKIGMALKTPKAVVSFLGQFPKVAKYAVPLIQNAIEFGAYSQLDPKLADNLGERVKNFGISVATAPLYTALGTLKSAYASIPASFSLGYGMARLSGANNHDALASGIAFSLLDGSARIGARTAARVTQDKADNALKSEALGVLNRFTDVPLTAKSSSEDITSVYRKAIQQVHPDKGGSDESFKAVNESFNMLTKGETASPESIKVDNTAERNPAKLLPEHIAEGKEALYQDAREIVKDQGVEGAVRAMVNEHGLAPEVARRVVSESIAANPNEVFPAVHNKIFTNTLESEREPSVLHILNPDGSHTIQAIKPGELSKFTDLIDRGDTNKAKALRDATGNNYHLSAKNAESMVESGAKPLPGYADHAAISKLADEHEAKAMEQQKAPTSGGIASFSNAKEVIPKKKKVAIVYPNRVEGKRQELLDAMRSHIPEYNNSHELKSVDALVDKVRELDSKKEADQVLIKHGSKYEVKISYPHSLGEMGNTQELHYASKPTPAEIKADILDIYKETKDEINEPLVAGIIAKSGRDENIEKAIDNVLSTKEKPNEAKKFVIKDDDLLKEKIKLQEELKKLEATPTMIESSGGLIYNKLRNHRISMAQAEITDIDTTRHKMSDERAKKQEETETLTKTPQIDGKVNPTYVSKQESDLNSAYKGGQASRTEGFSLAEEKMTDIAVTMELSQAGYRLHHEANSEGEYKVSGVSSTFPKWVPEKYRKTSLFEKILPSLEIGKLQYPSNPRATSERDFYNTILNVLDREAGIDTSAIRSNILDAYGDNRIREEVTPREGDSGIGGSGEIGAGREGSEVTGVDSNGVEFAKPFEGQKPLIEYTKIKRAGSGMASRGTVKMGAFAKEGNGATPNEPVKAHEFVRQLAAKYAERIGEGYTQGNIGLYHPETHNVRINGINNVSTAVHEITHHIDRTNKIVDQIMQVTGYTKDGKPKYDSATLSLRKEMTTMYEQYYPTGKHEHELQKRMVEGIATLVQKYVEMPATVEQNFPNITREFLKEGGKYYNEKIGGMIADTREFTAKYQDLSALDKVSAYVTSEGNETGKESFLSVGQQIRTFMADAIYPIEVLSEKAGLQMTDKDPSLFMRFYNNVPSVVIGNIKGDRGYWTWKGGKMVKLSEDNWQTLMDELAKRKVLSEFGSYLVARDQSSLYRELDKLQEELDAQKEVIKNMGGPAEAAKVVNEEGNSPIDEFKEIKKAYDELNGQLQNNPMTRDEVEAATTQGDPIFSKEAGLYDQFVRADLDVLREVGIVSGKDYARYTARDGYASLKREVYDELLGDENGNGAGMGKKINPSKVSSLKQRSGSQRTIINPVESAIKNHAEIMKKALRQEAINVLTRETFTNNFPELFQPTKLHRVFDASTGMTEYPQDRDPNIIMGRIDGKRVPVIVAKEVQDVVKNVLNHENATWFEKLVLSTSRMFTKGTTATFLPFIASNFTIDQWTAYANSQNGYKPVFSAVKEVYKAVTERVHHEDAAPELKYLDEYLSIGGERQTFAGWQDMSANELQEKISGEQKGLLRALDLLNSGINIFTLPAQYSEIITRATEYVLARKNGITQLAALEQAGRITAPFHHMGSWGGSKAAMLFVRAAPFANATTQVMDQTIRILQTKGGRQRYAFASALAILAGLGGLMALIMNGTDDQKKKYAQIQPALLARYIWIPSTDGKTFIRIRMPETIGAPMTLVNAMISDRFLRTNYAPSDYYQFGTAWIPNQFNIGNPMQMFFSWLPPGPKTVIEGAFNKRDFPKPMPIVNNAMMKLPPPLQYDERTSPLAKWVGTKADLSPIMLDFLVQGFFGRASSAAMGNISTLNPGSSFVYDPGFTSGRAVTSYYEKRDQIEQAYTAMHKGMLILPQKEMNDVIQKHGLGKSIETLLSTFRDIDVKKNPDRAIEVRDSIIKLMNAYND